MIFLKTTSTLALLAVATLLVVTAVRKYATISTGLDEVSADEFANEHYDPETLAQCLKILENYADKDMRKNALMGYGNAARRGAGFDELLLAGPLLKTERERLMLALALIETGEKPTWDMRAGFGTEWQTLLAEDYRKLVERFSRYD
ncbi:MAG: hypothetical protein PF961_23295 [Planctomycetota bacterium]|jgi:hypothetical protein|nr:hypothetical protein [Planctomycetota bacterium]